MLTPNFAAASAYNASLMSPLTADQATLVLGAASLPLLGAEHPLTKRVIAAIPADKADYRPNDVARSAIDLAWHIVASETRFLEAVAAGVFDFTGAARPESIRRPADVVDWYSERFAKDVERLKQMSGEQLARIIDFRGILQLPAVAYVQLGLTHSIHHRGQLSTYLRPMGASVPSIYGESFDARQAREKAQAASS
jgi:uncharacterized damage-inducible protein DinB